MGDIIHVLCAESVLIWRILGVGGAGTIQNVFCGHCHHLWPHCTVKHHTDIINFACMTWNFVRISASLSALCTNFYLFDIGIAFLAKFYPILM